MTYRISINDQLKALDEAAGGSGGKSVVILGAGLAGLTAGYELQQRGCKVRILEATGRVGGRVRTWYPEGKSGPWHEFGAMRIPDRHDFTRHYIDKAGLTPKLRPFITSYAEPDGYCYFQGRKFRMKDAAAHVPGLFSGLSEAERKAVERVKASGPTLSGAVMGRFFGPLMEQLTAADEAALLLEGPPTHFSELLENTNLGEMMMSFLSPEAKTLAGVVSALEVWWHQSVAIFIRENFLDQSEQFRLEELHGGMEQLPNGVFGLLDDGTVEFETAVTGIDNREDKVVLSLASTAADAPDGFAKIAGELKPIEADYVLCTIPFGVLRGISLSGLSTAKMAAIRNMHYASSTKVLLYVERRLWEAENPPIVGGATVSDTILRQTYYPSDHAPEDAFDQAGFAGADRPQSIHWVREPLELSLPEGFTAPEEEPAVLVASYSWGCDARRMGAIPYGERAARCIEILENIHPGIGATVKKSTSIFWNEDPWARGAFGFTQPHETRAHFEAGRAAEGRLYFAGEHLSFNQGWMQGAIKSSLASAEDLLRDIP